MEKAIRNALAAVILSLIANGRLIDAQQAGGSHEQQSPSILETISFMNKSVSPEMSSVSSANSCEVYIARNRRYTFALPRGQHVKSTDQFNVPHYAIDWLLIQEPEVARFKFAAIEPGSIKSSALPSAQFLKEHDLDEHPWERKDTDLTVVLFNTTDSTNSIESGHFELSSDGSSAHAVFDHSGSIGYIVFESKDRAERFVTAFVHAVNLCGGKNSDFPPTPSKR